MTVFTTMDDLKRNRIIELLQEEKRIDGRALKEYRSISIDVNVIPKANGSARVRLGDSEVICGIKIQPDRPFSDVGEKGIFICTAELLPLSHPTVETGPPNESVIELARVVDRGIRESHMIDLSQLVIKKDESVVGVFADNVVLDYDGNLFDACSYAATSAILTAKMPRWEYGEAGPELQDGLEPLPTTTIPVSTTMAKIGGQIVADPNSDEWDCMDARITITTNSDGDICALQKGGRSGFTADELATCGEIAINSSGKIRETLQAAVSK
ncbi:MAG: exosome complex protein Rrp42 [Cenarchaeum sp. SB0665_bin_23]|nr:exosome complex protein Rrp42 [Cenarchaeum sp. SB0667_bin_13]MXY37795.1 exosome complex protein Rrp42 [Cenarchaeum sp. SB0664_bin_35]MXY61094.1 exosome complex protein Rrp42 [Cenarchaeum sp. SB0665_bin_23]MXZ93483.1 exosome complex protein Rrp42 [Cenarchaeum sp. SB0666_bin_15]MYB47065.1 exosome complex protein Rrp42 [Cenarchaeum sp. SB0662_bin_33]MYC80448.1 exosome complex protein Rrp42 [Cenarchaeum sp. SB0661_bin_35]MYD58075.1 exosome complex protein Rrp42 [Cenarchaeum sp. SB0678_bin_8]M